MSDENELILYTTADGKVYRVDYYNLETIFAVGYRARAPRGAQFRNWVRQMLQFELLLAFFSCISTLLANTRAVPLVLRENAHKGRVFFCPHLSHQWKGAIA